MSDAKLSFENWYKLTYDKGGFIYPSQPMDKISFNTMVERVELYNSYLANGENKEQDKALHLRGVVFSEAEVCEHEWDYDLRSSVKICKKCNAKYLC